MNIFTKRIMLILAGTLLSGLALLAGDARPKARPAAPKPVLAASRPKTTTRAPRPQTRHGHRTAIKRTAQPRPAKGAHRVR